MTSVLVAGVAADALRALLARGGARAAAADGEVAAAVLEPDWRNGWRRGLEEVYAFTAEALPRLARTGRIVVAGPPLVAAPGPGYPEFVKARLALARWQRELGDRGLVVWAYNRDEVLRRIAAAVAQIPDSGLVGMNQ